MATQVTDKSEILEAISAMLVALEAECYRETVSLEFNDAWQTLEETMSELEIEING